MHLLRISLGLTLLSIAASPQRDHQVAKADVDRWMNGLSNWGRWGKDDQRAR
jgi:hypothetical protein